MSTWCGVFTIRADPGTEAVCFLDMAKFKSPVLLYSSRSSPRKNVCSSISSVRGPGSLFATGAGWAAAGDGAALGGGLTDRVSAPCLPVRPDETSSGL